VSAYVVRRILYAIPILIGVNLITFLLFFFVNTPEDMARVHLGSKRITAEQISRWLRQREYHLPDFYNNGWTEAGVRQVSGESARLHLPGRKEGAYRIRIEISTPAPGKTLTVRVETDDTAVLNLPSPFTEGNFTVALDGPPVQEFPFTFEGLEGEYHPVTLTLTPSEGAPMAVVRVLALEQLSTLERFTETIFWKKSVRFLLFQFGKSDDGRDIGAEIRKRIMPSLAVTIPIFFIGIFVNIVVAMTFALYRGSYLDFWGVIVSVILMSISILFFVIGGQWLLGIALRLVPVSGYDTGIHALKFVLLPVVIGIIGGIGSGVRWYRTIFLEEMEKDYIRTARAKGLPETTVLFKHALKNAMIPILTGVVVTIPFLFIGSLVLESFFSIPGMGSFTLEAIQRQDFAIVQAMVFLGSAMYIVGLIMTDISYTMVDPRVRLE
jgi:peptide/nickel transport system permease protein